MIDSNYRQKILSVIQQADNLPTLPDVMWKIRQVVNDLNSSADDLVNILNEDPAIISRVLKTVNSALFVPRGGRQVTDIREAVTRLGFREIQNIALSTAVFTACEQLPARLFDRRAFWKHCMCTAFLSVKLSEHASEGKKIQRDILHLGGLLHDVGRLLLETYFPDMVEESLKLALNANKPVYEIEQQLLEIDHAEVGKKLGEHWKLPKGAMEIVAFHHSPMKASEKYQRTVCLVHLANYVANSSDLGSGGEVARPVFQDEAWDVADVGPNAVEEVMNSLLDIEPELMQLLG